MTKRYGRNCKVTLEALTGTRIPHRHHSPCNPLPSIPFFPPSFPSPFLCSLAHTYYPLILPYHPISCNYLPSCVYINLLIVHRTRRCVGFLWRTGCDQSRAGDQVAPFVCDILYINPSMMRPKQSWRSGWHRRINILIYSLFFFLDDCIPHIMHHCIPHCMLLFCRYNEARRPNVSVYFHCIPYIVFLMSSLFLLFPILCLNLCILKVLRGSHNVARASWRRVYRLQKGTTQHGLQQICQVNNMMRACLITIIPHLISHDIRNISLNRSLYICSHYSCTDTPSPPFPSLCMMYDGTPSPPFPSLCMMYDVWCHPLSQIRPRSTLQIQRSQNAREISHATAGSGEADGTSQCAASDATQWGCGIARDAGDWWLSYVCWW